VTRGLRSRFTFDSADDLESIWSSDASKVVFASRQKGNFDLYMKSSTGAGGDEPLFTDKVEKFPLSWSADDRYILYVVTAGNPTTRSNDLWVLPLFGDKKPFPYVQTPFTEGPAEFSPDGKWVAYVSNESRRQEVFVSSFPEARGKWQVSTGGGTAPHWSPDGKELFYFGPDGKLMAAEVSGAASGFQVGAVNPLFEARPRTNARSFYDTADGKRFLFNINVEQGSPAPITLLVNLPTLLKK
jgi:Tol biopolymer transport system component